MWWKFRAREDGKSPDRERKKKESSRKAFWKNFRKHNSSYKLHSSSFFEKGKIVNHLGFVGHMVPVRAIQLFWHSAKQLSKYVSMAGFQ